MAICNIIEPFLKKFVKLLNWLLGNIWEKCDKEI